MTEVLRANVSLTQNDLADLCDALAVVKHGSHDEAQRLICDDLQARLRVKWLALQGLREAQPASK